MTRRATRQLNVRLPVDLMDEINLVTTVLDISQAELVADMARQYLARLPARVRRAVDGIRLARSGKS